MTCLTRVLAVEQLVDADMAATAATAQIIELVVELTGSASSTVAASFGDPVIPAQVDEACLALGGYVRMLQTGGTWVPDPPHTPLAVSTAYLGALRDARTLLGLQS